MHTYLKKARLTERRDTVLFWPHGLFGGYDSISVLSDSIPEERLLSKAEFKETGKEEVRPPGGWGGWGGCCFRERPGSEEDRGEGASRRFGGVELLVWV
jgi:hypothetical protein